jgi:lipopolysaccharide transport system ATP-binding protein
MDYKPAIKINNISKKYYRGALNEQSLRGITIHFWNNFNYKTIFKRKKKEAFWAVRNINLEVKKGEILGIIGNNGAGKSTLLKLLAGITPPTEGSIEIFGRIAPMLEIGAGFHGDLSGKDNIFLNGAIMGMKRKEIEKHFKEIMEFSGLATFVETPLKYYSSGMRIRLAFAIAAFLQPEILLVDEVLAVGDVAFQKKCLAKMEERAKQGITILFVSHDLEAVKRLCNRCVYLDNGNIKKIGSTSKIINMYLEDQQNSAIGGFHFISASLKETIVISEVKLLKERNEYFISEEIPIEAIINVIRKPPYNVQIWLELLNNASIVLFKTGINFQNDILKENSIIFTSLAIPPWHILPGNYSFRFSAWYPHNWENLHEIKSILPICIFNEFGKHSESIDDIAIVDCKWEVIGNN